ncbi:MAG: biotin synthase BioB [Peptostreptococcus sp.]|uniref:biotin synthase BioB n=1 Tax=Peptostreptococcus sp. TaxID=1262 RepID=UPI002FCB61EC
MNINTSNNNKIKAIKLKDMIIKGYKPSFEDIDILKSIDIDLLSGLACEIRDYFSDGQFELCTIINGKSGKCSENCSFCAQSVHHNTNIEEYDCLENKELTSSALTNYKNGVNRFSIVTSGRKLSANELDIVCGQFEAIKKICPINLCSSNGLLELDQFKKLRSSGVTRYHNNLETSRNFFPNICTSHSFDDKINAIKNAQLAGLSVCSGGIFGLGEDLDDRISMAFSLRDLNVDSVPINILNPITNTPLENNKPLEYDEIRRSISIYRFILPKINIRLAGGRILLSDKGKKAIESGLNSMISGEMLTTSGINTTDDTEMIKNMGFSIKKTNDRNILSDSLENIGEILLSNKNKVSSNTDNDYTKPSQSTLKEELNAMDYKNTSSFFYSKEISDNNQHNFLNRDDAIFVSGCNTDIGKTYISSQIINILKETGISLGYYKPVLSGAYLNNEKLVAGDCDYVVRHSYLDEDPNKLSSYIFKEAYSPHLAARFNNQLIESKKIVKDFKRISSLKDFTIVEGCGGIVCPIYESDNRLLMQEDLIKSMKLNTILVISSDLGSINAAITSYQYCLDKGINILAIIMNKFDINNVKHIDNKRLIEKLTATRVFFAKDTTI